MLLVHWRHPTTRRTLQAAPHRHYRSCNVSSRVNMRKYARAWHEKHARWECSVEKHKPIGALSSRRCDTLNICLYISKLCRGPTHSDDVSKWCAHECEWCVRIMLLCYARKTSVPCELGVATERARFASLKRRCCCCCAISRRWHIFLRLTCEHMRSTTAHNAVSPPAREHSTLAHSRARNGARSIVSWCSFWVVYLFMRTRVWARTVCVGG